MAALPLRALAQIMSPRTQPAGRQGPPPLELKVKRRTPTFGNLNRLCRVLILGATIFRLLVKTGNAFSPLFMAPNSLIFGVLIYLLPMVAALLVGIV